MITYFDLEDLVEHIWKDTMYSSKLSDIAKHKVFRKICGIKNSYDRRTVKLFLIYNLESLKTCWIHIKLAAKMFHDFNKYPQPEEINGDFDRMAEFYREHLIKSES